MKRMVLMTSVLLAVAAFGCKESPPQPQAAEPAAAVSAKKDDHDGHDHAAGDDHKDESAAHKGNGHHSEEVIELGETKNGEWTVRASRDKGVIKPGGETSIDVWVNGGKGDGVSSVRLWIGTENARGSIKAKAEIENDQWHTHTEVPNPMPEGAKLWVEIETDKGAKVVVGYDLKN